MAQYGVVQTQSFANDSQTAASAITVASATEMIQTTARWPMSPSPQIFVGTRFRFESNGVISTAATPGTARFDIRAGSIVVADTGALTLPASLTNQTWELVIRCRVSSIGSGTSAAIKSWFRFSINGQTQFVGSPGAGNGFDSTITNVMTSFFTQTVATGSMTWQDGAFTWDN